MDHATGVNSKGEVALFIDPTSAPPNGYRIQGRDLTVLAGQAELGTYALDDIAYGAASSRPHQEILIVEMDGRNEVVRTTPVPNVGEPAKNPK
jgi:hypothetical protein